MNRQTKTIILIGVLILHFSLTNAQNPDIKRTSHWYFGNGAGIDFSSGEAVVDTTGRLHTLEGCSTISDTSGNLLFYTDGDTVWNRNHQPMPNGTGLLGCGAWGSSSQTGLIVPLPSSDSLYYVFTSDCSENSGVAGFRYSVVNINLNNGLGDVTEKNVLLFAPSTEGIAATKHANGRDYWVVMHELNTDRFFTYLINENGLNTTPVISYSGTLYSYIAYLSFSYDGAILGASPFIDVNELYHFDKSSGILFDKIRYGYGTVGPWFSPDNSKIYLSGGNLIYQYCISNYDSAAIMNSEAIVAFTENNSDFGAVSNSAIDGRMYVSHVYYNDSMHIIQNPNSYGLKCNVQHNSLYLGGKQTGYGLPQFVSNFCYSSTNGNCDTILLDIITNNTETEITIFPNPVKDKVFIKTTRPFFSVQITDLYGKLILEKILNSSDEQIEVSDIANGIYFISINTKALDLCKKQKILIIH
jgi:hypothetical protein